MRHRTLWILALGARWPARRPRSSTCIRRGQSRSSRRRRGGLLHLAVQQTDTSREAAAATTAAVRDERDRHDPGRAFGRCARRGGGRGRRRDAGGAAAVPWQRARRAGGRTRPSAAAQQQQQGSQQQQPPSPSARSVFEGRDTRSSEFARRVTGIDGRQRCADAPAGAHRASLAALIGYRRATSRTTGRRPVRRALRCRRRRLCAARRIQSGVGCTRASALVVYAIRTSRH